MQVEKHIAIFHAVAHQNRSINWYAIIDSAQNPSLLAAIMLRGKRVQCFFDAARDSPLWKHSPHLVELPVPDPECAIWRLICKKGQSKPCVTVIASNASFLRIHESLTQAMEVEFDDGYCMFMAFWDPAILASLMGQNDDSTLHVQGPVLDADQRRRLGSHIFHWWYWDRRGIIHSINIESGVGQRQKIVLNQVQVDMLVEASLPDHILFHIKKNLPSLLRDRELSVQYERVRVALIAAREHGLASMADLVNFVYFSLYYGDCFNSDPEICDLLSQVKSKTMTFHEAAHNFP